MRETTDHLAIESNVLREYMRLLTRALLLDGGLNAERFKGYITASAESFQRSAAQESNPTVAAMLEAMANGVLECADDVDAAIDESPPENSFTRRSSTAKRAGSRGDDSIAQ